MLPPTKKQRISVKIENVFTFLWKKNIPVTLMISPMSPFAAKKYRLKKCLRKMRKSL